MCLTIFYKLFILYIIMDEETLNRLAAEALLEEAKVGARRAAVMGPSGWIKKKDSINKRFLHSTLRNVVLSNKHKTQSSKKKEHSPPRKPPEKK